MRPFEKGGATFAQAAFRWTLSNPHVDALIVSMTSAAEIDEYVGASGARSAAGEGLPLLQRYVRMNGASQCRYGCSECLSACPNGVPIGEILRTRMYAVDYGDPALARREYALLPADASPCLSCAAQPCRGACPHGLPIQRLLPPTHRLLTS
jgi:predicted aldo/keto reductase-like oxidoreductase